MSTDTSNPVTTPVAAPVVESAPQPDSQLDSRLAALTRREREIQQRQQAFSQEKAGMISKADLAKFWKEDRNKLRDLLGASEDEWRGLSTPQLPHEAPLQSIREELEALKRERAQEQQAKSVTDFKRSLGDFVRQSPDDYELISAYDAVDSVFDIMAEHYKEHGTVMDTKVACDYVENYLFNQLKQGTTTKKLSSLFPPSDTSGKQPSPTLTGTTAANPTSSVKQRLSPEESIAAAAKLIKWT